MKKIVLTGSDDSIDALLKMLRYHLPNKGIEVKEEKATRQKKEVKPVEANKELKPLISNKAKK